MSALVEALALLPHGPEFRFIDRLTQLTPGESGSGEYTVRGEEPFLQGHFPGQPILPGVLLLEAGAQLAGVVAQSDPSRKPLAALKLTAIRGAKILGAVGPGETVRIEARVTARMSGLVQASVIARVGDAVVLQAEVALSGTPHD